MISPFREPLLFLILALAGFFLLYRLGSAPLDVWDESRNGVNAFEFIERGDPVNMYYARSLEEWNVKPPLMIWCIAFWYKMLGFNTFSLRLTSALGALLAFYFLYRLVRLWESPRFAFAVCAVLITCQGIIGHHVGRSGDYDGLLLGFLMGGAFFFLRALGKDPIPAGDFVAAGCCWGLAFYAKGFAFVALFPGLLLYSIWWGDWRRLIRSGTWWYSLAILFAFPLSWYFIVQQWGLPHSGRLGADAFDTMWRYDIGKRITDPGFEESANANNFAIIIPYLDISFNVWNYLLFACAIYIIAWLTWYRRWGHFRLSILARISLCIAGTWSVLMTVASTKHFWYLAPALPFIAILMIYGLRFVIRRHQWVMGIFAVLWIFTAVRKGMEYHETLPLPPLFANNSAAFKAASAIAHYGIAQDQHILLYLYFWNKPNIFLYDMSQAAQLPPGTLLVTGEKRLPPEAALPSPFVALYHDGDYALWTRDE